MISGEVVKGKALGRTIDYPTANLELKEKYKLVPKYGVYIVKSKIHGRELFGITSIGTNPTVKGKERTIETHFLDFDGELYGEGITLEFLAKIRPEEKFESVEILRLAIAKDEAYAKEYLKNRE